MLNTWLPFACLVVLNLMFFVPGAMLAAEYWSDDAPGGKPHQTVYWFIQIMIGVYAVVWGIGLLSGLMSASAGVITAELTEGIVNTTLVLFLICIAFAVKTEKGYRKL